MNPFTIFTLFIRTNWSVSNNISSLFPSNKLILSINSSESWTGSILPRAKFSIERHIFASIMSVLHPLMEKKNHKKMTLHMLFKLFSCLKYIIFHCVKMKLKKTMKEYRNLQSKISQKFNKMQCQQGQGVNKIKTIKCLRWQWKKYQTKNIPIPFTTFPSWLKSYSLKLSSMNNLFLSLSCVRKSTVYFQSFMLKLMQSKKICGANCRP